MQCACRANCWWSTNLKKAIRFLDWRWIGKTIAPVWTTCGLDCSGDLSRKISMYMSTAAVNCAILLRIALARIRILALQWLSNPWSSQMLSWSQCFSSERFTSTWSWDEGDESASKQVHAEDVVSNLELVSNMLFQFCGRCFGWCMFQEDLDHSLSRPIAFKLFLEDGEFLL